MSYLALAAFLPVLHVRPCSGMAPAALLDDPSACRPCPSAAARSGRPFRSHRYARGCAGRYLSIQVLREAIPVRVRHRVEVVQVAEELVEAVQRRQVFVEIAQVVLAELAGRIAQDFSAVASVTAWSGMPTSAPAWPTVVKPVRIGISPVMKLARPAVQLASA